jgi:prepilin-type N-terminal cleavage/methylation domain-containing protein
MMTRRRGMSLVELTVAVLVLAVMVSVCMRFLRALADQRRGLQNRRVAVEEVANVMERLGARPWEDLTPEAIGQVPLSAEAQRAIPGGKLEVDVLRPAGDEGAKRVTVVLRWPTGPEQADRSVRLVAWRYRGVGK